MININENRRYHVSVLEKEFVNIFYKYFPKSRIAVSVLNNLGAYMYIRIYLGGKNRNDYSHGITDNDPMLHSFYIDLGDVVTSKIDKDGYITDNKFSIVLQRGSGVRLKDYKTVEVPFRKTTGDEKKLYKAFENYVAKLQKEVIKHAEEIEVPFDIYDKLPRNVRKTTKSYRGKRV